MQRVTSASVAVRADGGVQEVGAIGPGLLALVGVTHDDDVRTAARLADKLWHLRVFDDGAGAMNLSPAALAERDGRAEVMVVSQFTLYGDTRKGRRPSFVAAARPEQAEPLVEEVVMRLRAIGAVVATGRFRADMAVSLVNDGPVTLLVEV